MFSIKVSVSQLLSAGFSIHLVKSFKVLARRSIALLTSTSLMMSPLAASIANANELLTGHKIIEGKGTWSNPNANTLQFDQKSTNAIIEYYTFSIGEDKTVHFENGSGSTLNRVVGEYQSVIDGRLTATGSLLLVNPNGVIVGRNGAIDTGGSFLASTRDIKNDDFIDGGDNTFFGNSDHTVLNLGKVSSAGGDITLIAQKVENKGTLKAKNGNVGLAAGTEVLLRDNDHADGRILVKAGQSGGSVNHSGVIQAANAELRAHSGNIYALAQNRQGSIQVTGIKKSGGRIFLTANGGNVVTTQKISARRAMDTKRPQENKYEGGDVIINADIINVGGVIDVAGDLKKGGGSVDLKGDDFYISKAINAGNGVCDT